LEAAHQLNTSSNTKSSCEYSIHGVEPGDELTFPKSTMKVTLVKSFHSVPSVGYCFFDTKLKLKEEYKSLKGAEIAALRKQGVQIQTEQLVPLFVFTGDTTPQIFSQEILFQFPVIITECTYLNDSENEKAKKNSHTHWNEVKEIIKAHPNIIFVLTHFSCKYSDKFISEFFQKQNIKNAIAWLDGVDPIN